MQLPATSAGRSFQWLADIIHTVQVNRILFSCPNSLAEMITLIKVLEEQWHRIIEEEYTVYSNTYSKGHKKQE